MPLKRVGTLLRTAVTAGLLLVVLRKAGIFDAQGRSTLVQLITSARIPFLLASLAMGLALNLASAFKWYMLLRSRRIRVGLLRLYGYYMIGKFFNLLLPTSVGGDVVRIHALSRFTGKTAKSVASVFVERFTGLLTLMIITLAAVILNLQRFNKPLITVSLAAASLLIALVGWAVVDARPLAFLNRHFSRRAALLARLVAKLERFHLAVTEYRGDPAALGIAVANSLLFYLLGIVNVWISAAAFGPETRLVVMAVAVPVIFLIMNLPFSIGGIGLMEFAYLFTFELLGYSAALALSTALLMRFKTLLDAGLGGLIYLGLDQPQALKSDLMRPS